MRTLEEIIEQNYENLTYGEFVEYDMDCNCCPLYGEYCSGGIKCYGGMPIEPPCCSFDDDTILQDWCDKQAKFEYQRQEAEDRREKALALKKQKSEERKKKLREYKWRNSEDLYQIKKLKQRIKQEKKRIDAIDNIRCFARAVNSVNKMFRECHQPNDVADIDTKKLDDPIEICKKNIKQYELQIIEIQERIKQKEKLFKKQKVKGEKDE